MGEIADMMLDGFLDENGEYTGFSKKYYRKRSTLPLTGQHAVRGLREYVSYYIDKSQQPSKQAIRVILFEYAKHIKFPPIGNHQKAEDWEFEIAQKIQKDWNNFKTWLKKR